MLKTFATLIRGVSAEAEQAIFDANAVRILEQQLRDAAAALEASKRELACAMAHQTSEKKAVEALARRIAELTPWVEQALEQNRSALAMEAASAIAAAEDESRARVAAVERFDTDILRLRRLVEEGRLRLLELRRGMETARAEEALRRAGANGRRAALQGVGALREAEETLARIRSRHGEDEAMSAALDELDKAFSGRSLDEKFAEAGIGPSKRTRPEDVLARFGKPAGDAATVR
jgi:phage shock protein A